MEQPADRHAFAQRIEALDGGLGLQHLDLDAGLGQSVKRFRTDLQPLPYTS